MLKFTSVSASVRAITDITLTATTIHIRIGITVHTIGMAGIAITAIVIPTITGASLIRNSHTGLARNYFEPA
jgi:hypothetical protein